MEDIFTYLRKVSKPAFDVFDDLKARRDPLTNICWLSTQGLTSSQLKMFRSRIKELKDVGIIKKAKTWDKKRPIASGSYMINPGLIKPKDDPLNLISSAWEVL